MHVWPVGSHAQTQQQSSRQERGGLEGSVLLCACVCVCVSNSDEVGQLEQVVRIPWDLWNRGSGIKSFGKFFIIDGDRKGHWTQTHLPSLEFWLLQNWATFFLRRQFLLVSQCWDNKVFISVTRQRKTQNIRAPGINTLNLKTQTRHGGSLFWKQWVQGSLGSFRRQAKQHLFLLAVSMATVVMNGQLDGVSGLFMHWVVWREAESKKSEYNC